MQWIPPLVFAHLYNKMSQQQENSSGANINNTLEDDEVIILPHVDNSELVAQFRLSLVGRIFHQDGRSIDALIAFMPKPHIWDIEGRVRGLSLGNSRFKFDFDSEADIV